MKKLKVIVKDKSLLELDEDAKKGDLIDLNELTQVDSSYIENIIESGKDKVYEAKLNELRQELDSKNKVEIERLNNTIELLKKDNESKIKEKEHEIKDEYDLKINDYLKEIEVLKSNRELEIDKAIKDKENELNLKIKDLENTISNLNSSKEAEIDKINKDNQIQLLNLKQEDERKLKEMESNYLSKLNEKETEIKLSDSKFELEKNKALQLQKEEYDKKILEKEDIINNLQRAKVSMNVKQTGEDLESWCDNEVKSYMQNGLYNCTWNKDNLVVKEEGETKGSKADYIFRIYSDNSHNKDEELASICMDMKDENPDSINKKSNADYYKQLDNNRKKKNCKYALLVSNLEMDKPNMIPIFKVNDFEDMYVVRPAYLMTFLNMIASLTTRFATLVLQKEKESIEMKTKEEILEEFKKIKLTYLDKPLDSLSKSILTISKKSDLIKEACKSIDDECYDINKNYINQITEKINKFEINLNRDLRKIDKLDK